MTKEKTSFTPGPWNPVKDAQGTCGLMHPAKKGVAVAWFSSLHKPYNGYVGEEEHELGRPQREANVRLIAAAPDLYEALKEMLTGLECEYSRRVTETNFPKAYAALAKVEQP